MRKITDKSSYILACLFLFIIILFNYLLNDSFYKIIFFSIWIISVVLIYTLFFDIKYYLDNIKFDIKNITWPNKADVKQSTALVLGIIFIFSLVLWLIDSILTYLITRFL
jgi:preprotein translocase subunit SecE